MNKPERIRRTCRKAGFSQSALAELIKVQRSAVSNWESTNDVQPALQNLISIAKICAVSFEWLGTGRSKMSLEDESPHIQAAEAELVDLRDERDLLAMYRNLPQKKRQLMLDVLRVFLGPQKRI